MLSNQRTASKRVVNKAQTTRFNPARSLNVWFARTSTPWAILTLLSVAVAFSELIVIAMELVYYEMLLGEPAHLGRAVQITLVVAASVGTPLIVQFVLTVKSLERSKDRYRDMRDKAISESQSKSQFLANLSHELRTPLNAIIGFGEVMSKQILGPLNNDVYRDYATDIHASGSHLLRLIDDLLDLSRIEAGRIELQTEWIDIKDCLDGVVRMVEASARNKEIKLTLDASPRLPKLHADSQMLRQMVLNLLSNAIKFTPNGGTVAIRAEHSTGGGLDLEVEDTGIGIQANDIPKALEPFGQVEPVISRNNGGIGLGLSLVQSMTELHQGSMHIESKIGIGTTVTIRFPPSRISFETGSEAEVQAA
jgi:signal transduction histidine kinase